MSLKKLLEAATTTNKLLKLVNRTLWVTNVINAVTILVIAILLYVQLR